MLIQCFGKNIRYISNIRKLQSKLIMPFYAVQRGKKTGVFNSWAECEKHVKGFTKPRFKKFFTEDEAWEFVKGTTQEAGGYADTASSPHKPNEIPSKSTTQSQQNASLSSVKHCAKSNAMPSKSIPKSQQNVSLLSLKHCVGNMKQCMEQMRNYVTQAEEYVNCLQNIRKRNMDEKVDDEPDSKKVKKSVGSLNEEAESTEIGTVVYTDGACSNNGQIGAAAGIGVYWGPNNPKNISERLPGRQTNNRAEIHAAIRAIGQAKQMDISEVTVKTDSNFLIQSVTKWMPNWKKKNWTLSTGGPVVNREDFEVLDDCMQGIQVTWVHVKGHHGIEGNEYADQLACQGARMPSAD